MLYTVDHRNGITQVFLVLIVFTIAVKNCFENKVFKEVNQMIKEKLISGFFLWKEREQNKCIFPSILESSKFGLNFVVSERLWCGINDREILYWAYA